MVIDLLVLSVVLGLAGIASYKLSSILIRRNNDQASQQVSEVEGKTRKGNSSRSKRSVKKVGKRKSTIKK
jgi:predicted negative regulator of RcsB-dependent stress response